MQRLLPWPLLLVMCLGLGLRAAAVVVMGDRAPGPDAVDDYLPMAANLLDGRGFINAAGQPDSVRGPAYPLFIAAADSIGAGDPVQAVLWAQALLDTLTIALAWWIATLAFGRAAGIWSAALYAVNPLAAYACALVGPEILFAFLLTAAVAALQAGLARFSWVWFALAGLALGAAVLSRATPALLAPIWGVWIVWTCLSRRANTDADQPPAPGRTWVHLAQGVGFALALGLGAAVMVLPWTWRNWQVFGEFIPVAANGGVNFYAGSSERFWPPPPEHHRQREQRMDELIALGAAPAPEQWTGPGAGDKYFFKLGQANYRLAWEENPLALAAYLGRKSLRLWYATQSGRLELFVGLINAIWLSAAVLGTVIAIRSGALGKAMPLVLTVAYFPLILLAMFPLARYVVGFAPCLCALGAVTCCCLQQRLLRSARSHDRPAATTKRAASMRPERDAVAVR